MTTRQAERVYKSLWHLAIAGVGIYELRNHKTTLSKILAVGLIAFHADAAICDAIDIPTTPQRLLNKMLVEHSVTDYDCICGKMPHSVTCQHANWGKKC